MESPSPRKVNSGRWVPPPIPNALVSPEPPARRSETPKSLKRKTTPSVAADVDALRQQLAEWKLLVEKEVTARQRKDKDLTKVKKRLLILESNILEKDKEIVRLDKVSRGVSDYEFTQLQQQLETITREKDTEIIAMQSNHEKQVASLLQQVMDTEVSLIRCRGELTTSTFTERDEAIAVCRENDKLSQEIIEKNSEIEILQQQLTIKHNLNTPETEELPGEEYPPSDSPFPIVVQQHETHTPIPIQLLQNEITENHQNNNSIKCQINSSLCDLQLLTNRAEDENINKSSANTLHNTSTEQTSLVLSLQSQVDDLKQQLRVKKSNDTNVTLNNNYKQLQMERDQNNIEITSLRSKLQTVLDKIDEDVNECGSTAPQSENAKQKSTLQKATKILSEQLEDRDETIRLLTIEVRDLKSVKTTSLDTNDDVTFLSERRIRDAQAMESEQRYKEELVSLRDQTFALRSEVEFLRRQQDDNNKPVVKSSSPSISPLQVASLHKQLADLKSENTSLEESLNNKNNQIKQLESLNVIKQHEWDDKISSLEEQQQHKDKLVNDLKSDLVANTIQSEEQASQLLTTNISNDAEISSLQLKISRLTSQLSTQPTGNNTEKVRQLQHDLQSANKIINQQSVSLMVERQLVKAKDAELSKFKEL